MSRVPISWGWTLALGEALGQLPPLQHIQDLKPTTTTHDPQQTFLTMSQRPSLATYYALQPLRMRPERHNDTQVYFDLKLWHDWRWQRYPFWFVLARMYDMG